ncbi:MAG: NAD(P)H-quinone oxidoreductase [Pyrinomonadaceae bacterium]|nr:NAD(P)H-quinone oxidoreductase [Pyrinomonadaceae bacterium]
MKAVFIDDFSTGRGLSLTETADPRPPAGTEVLVRVRAAGLNRADLLQAKGLYPPPAGVSPNIPGLEFAGEVAAIGDRVAEWRAGDRVFGITAGEAQAEYLLIDERHLAQIPERLSFTEAAAVPEAFITAFDAVATQAGLSEGETLLIHAVGSGVGLAALQIGRSLGARVVGTSRTGGKIAACREFGLDAGIVAAEPIFAAAVVEASEGRGADVVLDLVGGAYFPEDLRCLAPKGRIMLVGLTSGRKAEADLGLILQKRATIRGTVLRGRSFDEKCGVIRSFRDQIVPLLADGTLMPVIDRVFAAADVLAAYDHLASNESFGKVVLEF